MNKVKIKLRDYLIVLTIAVVGLILGCFFEKDISKALYVNLNMPNVGHIVTNYMLIPYFFIFMVAIFTSLFGFYKLLKGKLRVFLIILFILGLGFLCFIAFKQFEDLQIIYGKVGCLIHNILVMIALLVSSFLFSYLYFIRKFDMKRLLIVSITVIANAALVVALYLLLKYVFSRPRPYYVFDNLDEYRYIWELRPFQHFSDEAFKSCPSGHTMSFTSFIGIGLCYLSLYKEDNNKLYNVVFYTAFAFVLIGALLRMVAGMHFLSDVSFAVILSSTLWYFGLKLQNHIIDKYNL